MILLITLEAAMQAYDATPRLHELAGIPTLVVAARHDRIARLEVVRALAAGIPGSRLDEFDDAAHGVTIQCADRINTLLHDHISQSALDQRYVDLHCMNEPSPA